ncbi:exosome complex protein Rrp42 [Candidatus Woesearchaeota archaeon]|nr:exosome complex protein Rrp42 [Candidatus Woesearchaeota archaeon]
MRIMQKQHLLKTLAAGIRYDGRKLLEWRPVTVEYNISKSAEGSARVTFGGTQVLAGVKMSVEKPYPDTPNQGNLMVNAELVALSSPKFETGPPGDQAIELARVVDRGIRESHAIDQEELCITPAEKVWSVMIDVISMNDEGGLQDASALAALAALKDARYPKFEEGKVDYGTRTDTPVPLAHEPISVTVFKIGSHFIVDPLPEEEEHLDARLTITTTADGTLVALQKGGEAPLTVEDIDQMVGIAVEKAPELRAKVSR